VLAVWRSGSVICRMNVSYSMLSPVSAGMDDYLRAGMSSPYVTTQPTQLSLASLDLGSLNRVPALICWGTGGMSPLRGGRYFQGRSQALAWGVQLLAPQTEFANFDISV